MKKLTIGLAVILVGVAANSFAGVSAWRSPFCVSVPNLCGGLNVGVTSLWWQASKPQRDYALTFSDFTSPIDDPFGPFDVEFTDGRHHHLDHNYQWGYRINVDYIFPCSGNDVGLAYTHWDHDDSDHVNRNRGVIIPTLTNDTIGGTIIFPATDIIFDNPALPAGPISLFEIFSVYEVAPVGGVPIDVASASSDIKYHAWDLEFGQYVNVGCNTRMHWFAGLRWTQLERRLNVTYAGALTDIDVTDAVESIVAIDIDSATLSMDAALKIYTKSDFNGIGPRFGTNINYSFACTGLGIVAEGSASLLVGELSSHFRETEHFRAVLTEVPLGGGAAVSDPVNVDERESFKHPDETRIVPNLEGKVGVNYAVVFCNRSKVSLEAGYMVTHYFNSDDSLSEVGLDSPEFRTRHTLDTSFDGPYVTLQVQM